MTDRLIFGKISCIRKQSWTVENIDPPEKLTFRCTFSLNAKKGDIYYGYLKKEGEIWTASTLPMIKISFSDQNIQEMIHKGLRCARGALDWKYAHIQSRAELLGYNSVQEYIDETIASYRRVPDEDILEGIFPGEKKENVLRFFRDWDALMLRRFEVLGIEKKELMAINRPPSELYKLIFENPLKVPEIDITRAKEILRRMSRAVVPIEEFYGLLLREVHQNLVSGHAYMDSKSLEAQFPDLDGELIKGFGLCWDKAKGRIYMQSVYEKNKRLAIYLVTRMQTQCPVREINEEIKSPNLTEEQERGLRMALTSPLSIITGRGGCGKSTLIGEIYKQEGDCMLMSFTGKAVSKLSEITGDNAPSTIHKVISKFEVKKTTKHIVVDEASMANTELILGLFETFPYPAYNFRITFVGDPNQLPPISWGAFFEQVISTSQIPTTHLTTNLRVVKAENDGILLNCTNLLEHVKLAPTINEVRPFKFSVTENFQIRMGDEKTAAEVLISRYRLGLPIHDTIIVTPYNKHVKEINMLCQKECMKGKAKTYDSANQVWHVGAPVCNKVNNYFKMIMNGDRGVVHDIEGDRVIVKINGGYTHYITKVQYVGNEGNPSYLGAVSGLEEDAFTNTGTLQLDYASTVHSAQGSEWDNVIVYIPAQYFANHFMVTYRLIYTMISRAKKKVWLIGDINEINTYAVMPPKEKRDNFYEMLMKALE